MKAVLPAQHIDRPKSLGKGQFAALSKNWSSVVEHLEVHGFWADLVEQVSQIQKPNERSQAALARAHAFLGHRERAQELLSKIANAKDDARIVARLTHSLLLRQTGEWAAAKRNALIALSLSKRSNSQHLRGDAQFAVALCLAEEGRVFLATEQYRAIRENKRLSNNRRGLAAMNEAWALWDLGRTELIAEVLPDVPAPYRIRMELCLSFVSGNDQLAHYLLTHSHVSETLVREREEIRLLLLEWALLEFESLNDSRLASSWVLTTLAPVSNTFLTQLHSLLGEKISAAGKTQIFDGTWIERLELNFVRALLTAREDVKSAERLYRETVDPLLREHRLQTPLIPTFDDIAATAKKQNAWLGRLAKHFGLTEATDTRRVFRVKQGILSMDGSSKSLDFKRSPTTVRLLEILSGQAGRSFTKRAIHEQLTGSRYVARLHDDRLHKLLKRLSDRIDSEFPIKLFYMPGDNSVMLLENMEIGQ